MPKVLIVSPCVNLPVPAVQGGAVSTLVEYLMKENEVQKKMDLTVLSIFHPEAVQAAQRYRFTKTEFVTCSPALDLADRCLDGGFSLIKGGQPHQYFRKGNSLRYIRRYLKENDFDKVVFQNSGFLLNVLHDAGLCAKYRGKLYYHLHNDLSKNVYVEGVKQCTLLLISEYLKNGVNRVCGQDLEAQCRIVKNGFDCEHFVQFLSQEEQCEMRKKLGIDPQKKIVLFTGRITPAKGIEELTDAIAGLERRDVVLMVVGAHNFGTGQTSEFQEKMKRKFSQLGQRVCFTGFVPYWEIWKYYKMASVAVLPSMWEEPAGLTMLEACAAGVPLVTTRSGGIPEYIQEENSILLERNSGIVPQIQNAICEILDHEADWMQKAQRAKAYTAANFGLDSFYHAFVQGIGGIH